MHPMQPPGPVRAPHAAGRPCACTPCSRQALCVHPMQPAGPVRAPHAAARPCACTPCTPMLLTSPWEPHGMCTWRRPASTVHEGSWPSPTEAPPAPPPRPTHAPAAEPAHAAASGWAPAPLSRPLAGTARQRGPATLAGTAGGLGGTPGAAAALPPNKRAKLQRMDMLCTLSVMLTRSPCAAWVAWAPTLPFLHSHPLLKSEFLLAALTRAKALPLLAAGPVGVLGPLPRARAAACTELSEMTTSHISSCAHSHTHAHAHAQHRSAEEENRRNLLMPTGHATSATRHACSGPPACLAPQKPGGSWPLPQPPQHGAKQAQRAGPPPPHACMSCGRCAAGACQTGWRAAINRSPHRGHRTCSECRETKEPHIHCPVGPLQDGQALCRPAKQPHSARRTVLPAPSPPPPPLSPLIERHRAHPGVMAPAHPHHAPLLRPVHRHQVVLTPRSNVAPVRTPCAA